jgi:transcriptional regulator with XRE-family HTH domain
MIKKKKNGVHHMDNQEFGSRISEARKKNGMTQRELAEQLDVTDKAVSKWECGKGFPEITLLPKLSKVLGIKPEDLLTDKPQVEKAGIQAEPVPSQIESVDPQVELVTNIIRYSGEQQYRKLSRLVFPIICGALGIAAFVCALVDFCLTQSLTWSRFPLSALLFCFVVLFPIFLLKKHRTAFGAVVFLAGLIPFLLYLETLVPAKGWVIGLALPIVAMSAVCTALTIWLFLYSKIDHLISSAIVLMVAGVGLNFSINEIVQRYLNKQQFNISVAITAIAFAVATVILVVVALSRRAVMKKSKK